VARSLSLAAVFSLVGVAACGDEVPPGESVAFDPCQPLALVPDPGATAEEVQGIAAGAALWNAIASVRLTIATDGAPATTPALPIHYQAAAPAFHGFYDGTTGQVFINTDLGGNAQAVTVAHEIGHAFGLSHVPSGQRVSVMNPGNLNVEPNTGDVDTLALRWGACREPAYP
jgi:hypothetical protein